MCLVFWGSLEFTHSSKITESTSGNNCAKFHLYCQKQYSGNGMRQDRKSIWALDHYQHQWPWTPNYIYASQPTASDSSASSLSVPSNSSYASWGIMHVMSEVAWTVAWTKTRNHTLLCMCHIGNCAGSIEFNVHWQKNQSGHLTWDCRYRNTWQFHLVLRQ